MDELDDDGLEPLTDERCCVSGCKNRTLALYCAQHRAELARLDCDECDDAEGEPHA